MFNFNFFLIMKKCLSQFFAQYSNIDLTAVTPAEPLVDYVDDSDLKKVLDEIFTVDPVSGLPQGDYQYYMSSSGNPVVKQWLENNLLRPRMSSGGSSVEGVTDDMIFEMSRKSGESVSDYQSRLTSLYDSAKAEYDRYLSEIKSE